MAEEALFNFHNELPDSVRDILVDFSMAYLLDQTEDIVGFAVNFFKTQQRNRKTLLSYEQKGSDSTIDELDLMHRCLQRRMSVSGEPDDEGHDIRDSVDDLFPKSDKERIKLKNTLKRALLFNSSEDGELEAVIYRMFRREAKANEVVTYENSDYFYVVISGIFEKFINNRVVQIFDNDGCFGEVALLFNSEREGIIRAKTDGSLWVLDRRTFKHIMLQASKRRLKLFDNTLSAIPALKSLTTYERIMLADALELISFNPGDIIYRRGDRMKGFYFIISGSISINWNADDTSTQIVVYSFAEIFGVSELLVSTRRLFCVVSLEHTDVGFLDIEKFKSFRGTTKEAIEVEGKRKREAHFRDL